MAGTLDEARLEESIRLGRLWEGEPGSGVKGLTLEQRLWRLSTREGSCWVWNGSRSESGYGRINIVGTGLAYVHRVAYEEFIGPIPEGLTIDHLCRNRACWRPSHLEAATSRLNTLRGEGTAAHRFLQDHCHRGHALAGENLYRYKGHRYCRRCQWTRTQMGRWARQVTNV